MIDYAEALARIRQHISALNAQILDVHESQKGFTPKERKVLRLGPADEDPVELVLIEDATMHIKGGWAFSYQDKKYLETGDFQDMLLGHGVVIVSSSDGTLYETGSTHHPSFFIKNFEENGDPYIESQVQGGRLYRLIRAISNHWGSKRPTGS